MMDRSSPLLVAIVLWSAVTLLWGLLCPALLLFLIATDVPAAQATATTTSRARSSPLTLAELNQHDLMDLQRRALAAYDNRDGVQRVVGFMSDFAGFERLFSERSRGVARLTGVLYTLGLLLAAVAKVYSSIARYRLWASIPEAYRSISPGRAVGFWWIPFFSFYWFFVVYPRFVREAGDYSGQKGNMGLAIAFAVLLCVLGPVISGTQLASILIVPLYVVWLLMTLSMDRQAKACVERWSRTPSIESAIR
jgi:hypothetical protein